MLVNLLIILFFSLILYQFLASCKREGLENSAGTYQNYPDDPLILGKVNAGNIEVLKKEVEQIPEIKNRLNRLEEDVKVINEQIVGLNEQNAQAVSSFSNTTSMLTGSSGTTEEGGTSSWTSFGGSSGKEGETNAEGDSSSSGLSSWTSFGGSSGDTTTDTTNTTNTTNTTTEGDSSSSGLSSWTSFGGSSGGEGEKKEETTTTTTTTNSLSSYF